MEKINLKKAFLISIFSLSVIFLWLIILINKFDLSFTVIFLIIALIIYGILWFFGILAYESTKYKIFPLVWIWLCTLTLFYSLFFTLSFYFDFNLPLFFSYILIFLAILSLLSSLIVAILLFFSGQHYKWFLFFILLILLILFMFSMLFSWLNMDYFRIYYFIVPVFLPILFGLILVFGASKIIFNLFKLVKK